MTSINKNGEAYAFNRNDLAAGPVWTQQIAIGGDCPTCGESSVSSGAFGGGTLFLAGNNGVINGAGYPGTVRALNPSNGAFLWQHGAPGSVIGALAYDNGMVFDGGGNYLEVLNATTGQRLYSYNTGSQIYAGPSIANGVVYVGNTAGQVDAFSPSLPSTTPPLTELPDRIHLSGIGIPPRPGPRPSRRQLDGFGRRAGMTGATDSFRLMSEPTGGDAQVSAGCTDAPGGCGRPGRGDDPAEQQPRLPVLRRVGRARKYTESPVPNGVRRPDDGGCHSFRRRSTAVCADPACGRRLARPPSPPTARPHARVGQRRQYPSAGRKPGRSGRQFRLPGHQRHRHRLRCRHRCAQRHLVPPASPSPCPSGWNCQDIGNPALVGNQSLSSATWTAQGAGNGIGQQQPPPTRPGRSTISSTMSGSRLPVTARSAPM